MEQLGRSDMTTILAVIWLLSIVAWFILLLIYIDRLSKKDLIVSEKAYPLVLQVTYKKNTDKRDNALRRWVVGLLIFLVCFPFLIYVIAKLK